MKSWGKAIGYGFLVWLTLFIVAFLIFPVHDSNRPLFESIMAVTVSSTAVIFGLLYLKRLSHNFIREGIQLGILWFIISILIDTPFMLLGGPMKISFGYYMSDIGITYLCLPVITCGLSVAFDRAQNKENDPESDDS